MREIIFRGKRKDNGEWVEGYYGEYYNGKKNISCISISSKEAVSGSLCYDIIPETVGQYTGMTDKNGTEVFEGDIVKGKSEYFGNGSLNQKAVVLYDRGQFLLSFGETLEECKQLNDFEVVGVWSGDVEVIGNIHDNPELLEE
jgi:uncharacterized phage protein (TIGR01671 family)